MVLKPKLMPGDVLWFTSELAKYAGPRRRYYVVLLSPKKGNVTVLGSDMKRHVLCLNSIKSLFTSGYGGKV